MNEQKHNLAELLLDESLGWRVHNCKLSKNQCHSEGKLPFIYHYDRLSNELKQQFALTGELLSNFNKPMTAEQACQLIGIDKECIPSPKYVKINGSLVVFCEPLQLAIRLHWSNTSKAEEPIYCQNQQQAVSQAIQKWQFIGRVDTLYKLKEQNSLINIGVYDELAILEDESYYRLPISDGYQLMPYKFSCAFLTELNNHLQKLSWIEQVIFNRVI